jgi:pilus assembly protein Flp/PilA
MESGMKKALELIRGVGTDTEGAALIEYTVLLGIMLVAVIATIIAVGAWITGQWTSLQAALP